MRASVVAPMVALLACAGPPPSLTPLIPPTPLAPEREGPIPNGGGVVARADGEVSSTHFDALGPTTRLIHVDEATAYIEPTGGALYGRPSAAVHVAVDEPVVLVLHTHRNMAWSLTESFPGSIERVILAGTRHANVLQSMFETESIPLLFNAYEFDMLSSNTRRLEAELSTLGLELHSVHDAGAAGAITLEPSDQPNDLQSGPDCGVPGESLSNDRGSFVDAACPELAEDDTVCLMSGPHPSVLGIESGTVCDLDIDLAPHLDVDLFGWAGDELYTCGHSGAVSRSNLVTGEVDRAFLPCGSATVVGRELVVDGEFYPTFLDAQCGRTETSASGEWLGGGDWGVVKRQGRLVAVSPTSTVDMASDRGGMSTLRGASVAGGWLVVLANAGVVGAYANTESAGLEVHETTRGVACRSRSEN